MTVNNRPQVTIASSQMSSLPSTIEKIEVFGYPLTYAEGDYVMSGGRVVTVLESTVVRLSTSDGLVGHGEVCPLGSNYLPAHAAGARAAIAEIAPHLLGADAANPKAIALAMERALLGHPYAKSAIDLAVWDVLGQASGQPVCDLLGGRLHEDFPLYKAVSLASPEQMREQMERFRAAGIHHFQLKLGGDPSEDAARARAIVEATEPGDIVLGDANCGWRLPEAIIAAQQMAELPRFFLEQPCATLEECARVRDHTGAPLILDEVIVDLQSLLRAWELGALIGFNLKLSRVGGLTPARLLREVGEELGLMVNIEDAWGGDIAVAAVSHLAASTDPRALTMVSFINDWTEEHVLSDRPQAVDGRGRAPSEPGLGGGEVDEGLLGEPLASFELAE
jgi:L-alanine-DL-glutamate epimerase-like enolase superfamily enzyme